MFYFALIFLIFSFSVHNWMFEPTDVNFVMTNLLTTFKYVPDPVLVKNISASYLGHLDFLYEGKVLSNLPVIKTKINNSSFIDCLFYMDYLIKVQRFLLDATSNEYYQSTVYLDILSLKQQLQIHAKTLNFKL